MQITISYSQPEKVRLDTLKEGDCFVEGETTGIVTPIYDTSSGPFLCVIYFYDNKRPYVYAMSRVGYNMVTPLGKPEIKVEQ